MATQPKPKPAAAKPGDAAKPPPPASSAPRPSLADLEARPNYEIRNMTRAELAERLARGRDS